MQVFSCEFRSSDGANRRHARGEPDPPAGPQGVPDVAGRACRPTATSTAPPSTAPSPTSSGARSRPASTSSTTARWARRPGSPTSTSASAASSPRPSRSRAACCRRAATASSSRAPTPRSTRSRGADRESRGGRDEPPRRATPTRCVWVCTGPITYDRAAIDRDIANLKAALEGHAGVEAFLPVVAPARAYWLQNEHYGSEEEFVYALADALRQEYKAIVDSGLQVQVDDAVLMHECDSMLSLGQTSRTTAAGRSCASTRSTTRCAGSPRTASATTSAGAAGTVRTCTTRRCATSVDLLLAVNAAITRSSRPTRATSTSGGSGRTSSCPRARKLIPGVVTHHTNVVEHPELVAQRLVRLANVVGART